MFGLHLYLECKKDGKEELILLIVASGRVFECLERQVLDDVVDALASDWRLDGACHRDVEDSEELLQRSLVHDVDDAHLNDEEVENTASCSNCQ